MSGDGVVGFGPAEERIGAPASAVAELRRRLTGRHARDAFGLDLQLADLLRPLLHAVVRVEVSGADHVQPGAATLIANRGLGVAEPTAVAVAVARTLGRRARVVGAPGVAGFGALLRRLGAIAASPADVRAALAAGHLIVLPLAPTWLRTGAGTPPLELVQAVLGHPAHPVAVRPGGPLGLAVRPWQVVIGAALAVDSSYAGGDPLAAADLAEAARAAVAGLLELPAGTAT